MENSSQSVLIKRLNEIEKTQVVLAETMGQMMSSIVYAFDAQNHFLNTSLEKFVKDKIINTQTKNEINRNNKDLLNKFVCSLKLIQDRYINTAVEKKMIDNVIKRIHRQENKRMINIAFKKHDGPKY